MHQFAKHFTLEEARALIPELRAAFRDIHRRRERARSADDKLAKLVQQTGGDHGGQTVSEMILETVQLNAQLNRILGLGIQIKDLDRGLVDFPHLRDGREVFLCWELDEDDIGFWHDIDAGYGGRERL